MKKTAFALLVVLGALAGPAAAPADTHALVESSRFYMDQETKVAFEYWVAGDRSCRKALGRATIIREDLGLVWSVDFNARTYTETPIAKVSPAAARPRNPDMRKLWLDYYDPDYSWTVRETGETKTLLGHECRLFEATGEADFAEISARYWICLTPGVPGGRALRDTALNQFQGDRRMAALVRILQEHPDAFCAAREETVEPSIAPTIKTRTRLTELAQAAAPPGSYEVPHGFKRLPNRGDDR